MKIKVAQPRGTWDLLILFWSAYVVFAISFEHLAPPDEDVSRYLLVGDTVACAFFFFDVVWRWLASEDKLRFWKWGWIDLLASIPVVDQLRWGRLFRVFRIFRVVRGLRSAGRVAGYFFEDRVKTLMATASIALFGSVLIFGLLALEVEKSAPGANITTALDAIWWALTTVTTVGYGDRFPVTDEGKIVGMGLMLVGISLFGMLSGLLASWLITPKAEAKANADIAENSGNISENAEGIASNSAQIAELKAALKRIEEKLDAKN